MSTTDMLGLTNIILGILNFATWLWLDKLPLNLWVSGWAIGTGLTMIFI